MTKRIPLPQTSNRLLVTLIFYSATLWCCAQSTDLLKLEYLQMPSNSSGVRTTRVKALANVPIFLDSTNVLFAGVEYNRLHFSYEEDLGFNTEDIEKFSIIDLNLGYLTNWNERWKFIGILTPRLASNFESGVVARDFFLNATATLWKENQKADKPFRLILGLTFNSTSGLPVPLPLVNYTRRFHPNWSFTLGVPKMEIRHYATPSQSVFVETKLDGYFLNIQNSLTLPNGDIAGRNSLSALVLGGGYQCQFGERLKFYLTGGTTLIQNAILRDRQRKNLLTLNNQMSFYFKSGVKLSLF